MFSLARLGAPILFQSTLSQGRMALWLAIVQVHETRPKAVRSWNLGAYVEVADAELFAIQRALQAATDITPCTKRLFIFSDSQAAIQKLSGWNSLAVKARTVVEQGGCTHSALQFRPLGLGSAAMLRISCLLLGSPLKLNS